MFESVDSIKVSKNGRYLFLFYENKTKIYDLYINKMIKTCKRLNFKERKLQIIADDKNLKFYEDNRLLFDGEFYNLQEDIFAKDVKDVIKIGDKFYFVVVVFSGFSSFRVPKVGLYDEEYNYILTPTHLKDFNQKNYLLLYLDDEMTLIDKKDFKKYKYNFKNH